MKIVLTLFASLILMLSSLAVVQAEVSDSQESTQQAGASSENTESSAERSDWSKRLFEGRCQMCHQLPEPDMLKPNQWKLILVTMQQRMQQAGVPPLTEEETNMILEYIAEQSR